MTEPGVFTLSLDTELAWGSFDKGGVDRYREEYRETPEVVERLCSLFEEYDVTATWAVVAHLFADCDGHPATSTGDGATDTPVDSDRQAWLASAPCSTGVDRSLWYAPELLEQVRNCSTPQDIGLHGYSHLVFGEHSRSGAMAELADAMAAAHDAGLNPSSFVYPRNDIAHADVLSEHSLDIYRGVDARWYERQPLGAGRKPLRFLDEVLRRTPPVVRPREHEGVVCLPGSQVFRPDDGAWAWTPEDSQFVRARKGLDRAAATGDVFHLWCHPFNLAGDIDHHLAIVEDILTYVDELRANDELEIMSMADVARAYRDGRWQQEAASRD